MDHKIKDPKDLARLIRCQSLKMVEGAKAAHIGSALSIADIVAVLYSEILRYKSDRPDWDGRDRFILSKGHACVAIYSALAEVGFFERNLLDQYGKNASEFMNHISHKVKGVEFSTGSLGHGLSFGVGKAVALKRKSVSAKVYVLLSDGELNEGSNWEATMFAAHHQLDNLVAIIDYNNLQSLTTVEQTLKLEPIGKKFEAFGWDVKQVNGHNLEELTNAFSSIPWYKDKPSVLICETIKGHGVSFMHNKVEWHYRPPNKEQLKAALEELKNA